MYKSVEYRNGEKQMKAPMAVRWSMVWFILGGREKEMAKDPPYPYPEPTQVPLGEKPQACRVHSRQGNSANWSRTLGIRDAGRSGLKLGTASRSN